MSEKPVKVFISYSWDSEEHKAWVRKLSDDLESNGIVTILDQKDLRLGDSMTHFMEESINKSKYVLMILTPNYKIRSDQDKGGVGFEEQIITAEVNEKKNHRKFITILASGTHKTSTPVWAKNKYGIDLSNDATYNYQLDILVAELYRGKQSAHHKYEGDKLHKEKAYKEAINCYSKAIQINSKNARLYFSRGDSYLLLASAENDAETAKNAALKAVEDFSSAFALLPESKKCEALCRRGCAYLFLENYFETISQAILDFADALERNSEDINAHYLCGRALYNRGMKQSRVGVSYTQRALTFGLANTDDPFERDILEAIAHFSKVLSIDSKLIAVYYDRAAAYKAIGKYEKAEDDIAKAARLLDYEELAEDRSKQSYTYGTGWHKYFD